MSRIRFLPAFALVLPLLLCGGTVVAKAQPPDGPPFDDGGPLFGDGPRGPRPGERPGGPGGGGPGGHGPRGGKGGLDGAWHGIARLQSDKKSLSKSQAAKLVALVKPWTSKAAMSDAEAQKLAASIGAVLTSAQKSQMGPPGRGGPPNGGRGGPPPDRGEGPPPPPPDGEGWGPPPPDGEGGPPPRQGGGGPSGGRGGRPLFPATFNPFYAPTGRSDWKSLPASTQQFLARRYRENRAVLESLSRYAKS